MFCLVAAWLTFQPGIVDAQGVLTLSVGSGPISVAPGSVLVVPLTLDMSAAAGANVAALTTGITWGPARLTLDSVRPGTLGTPTVNTAAASSGSASLSIFNAVGATTTQTVAQLYFTTQGQPGGTRIALTPTVAANETGATVLAQLFTRPLDVCIGQGLWGDVTGDNAVNIIDAQQIARYSVGLSVLNPTVLTTVGDVNADNSVNIIDAQQLARFSVGLSSAARVNTPFNPTPSVASVTMSPTVAALTVGQRVQVTGTPRDSTGADIAGCTAVTYVSSAPLIASVNGFGLVTAIGSGTANIIASAGARSAQSSITIGGGAGTPVLTLSPSSLLFNGVVAGTNPPSQAVTITNGGTGTLSGLSLGSVVYGGAATGWLQLSSLSATSAAPTATFSVQPLTASLPAGTYSATIPVLSGSANNSPQNVSVSLTVTAPAIASVTVSPASATIPLGLRQTFTATARDAQGNVVPGVAFSWISSNSGIASANTSTGEVTAISTGGPVTISAFTGPIGGTAAVTVSNPTLTVNIVGQGGGVVQSGNLDINCSFSSLPRACPPTAYPSGSTVTLVGSGDGNTSFLAFSGDNNCNGLSCSVQLTTSKTITATFRVFSWDEVAAGFDHTCGIVNKAADGFGEAYCWGANSAGELGDGTTTARRTPVKVGGGFRFRSITVGFQFTCAIDAGVPGDTDRLWCWGANGNGKLGAGAVGSIRTQPTPVVGAGSRTVSRVDAGANHACLLRQGEVWCWGLNSSGQLGSSGPANSDTPIRAVAGLGTMTGITTGYNFTCSTTAQSTYCWGDNTYGQLGDGSNIGRATPAPVSNQVSPFTAAYAGGYHACAASQSQETFCWGRNDAGQIFGNANGIVTTPWNVSNPSSNKWIAPGGRFTCITPQGLTGFLVCNGSNSSGQLGGSFQYAGGLSSGDEHVCGLSARTGGNDLYCWGLNGSGQLGDGTTVSRQTRLLVNKVGP